MDHTHIFCASEVKGMVILWSCGKYAFFPLYQKYRNKSAPDASVRRWMVKNQKNSMCGWVQGAVSTSLVWFIGGIGSLLCGCFRWLFLEYPKSKKLPCKIIHHNFFHRHSQTSKSSSLERGKNSTHKSVFILLVDSVQKYLCIVIYFSYSMI